MSQAVISEKRKERIRTVLMELKKILLTDVHKSIEDNLSEDIRMSFELFQDNGDKSVDDLLKHVSATIVGNKTETIDDIDEALKNLEEGSYGICEGCGDRIPVKRLKVMPFATCCIHCQDEEDKKQKGKMYPGEQPTIAEKRNNYSLDEE